MNRFFYLVIVFGGFLSVAQAQSTSDSVYVYKGFLGYKYVQHDNRLNFNQLPDIIEENQEAFKLIKKARTHHTFFSIISGTGGFLIGWQLGTALVGGDPNWTMAAIGGGLIVVSIPLYTTSLRKSLDAIDLYNSGLMSTSFRLQLNFELTSNGIGFCLRF